MDPGPEDVVNMRILIPKLIKNTGRGYSISTLESERARARSERRDEIAATMWDSYRTRS